MLDEFKNFAFKGNAFDLAVGVIIGGAFGKIVGSIVDDLIMPIIGALFGGLDFNNYFFGLSSTVNAPTLEAAKAQGATFAYGSFHHRFDPVPDHRFHPVPDGEDFEPVEKSRKASPAAGSDDHRSPAQGNPRRAGYCQKEVSV